MQNILTSLTALRNHHMQEVEASRDPLLLAKIDLLNTALAALHHYAAPDAKLREALNL